MNLDKKTAIKLRDILINIKHNKQHSVFIEKGIYVLAPHGNRKHYKFVCKNYIFATYINGRMIIKPYKQNKIDKTFFEIFTDTLYYLDIEVLYGRL